MRRLAEISDDGRYRYKLSRWWSDDLGIDAVVWMMLNPSTADAEQDDATIRRCIGFSQRWGYDGLVVVNLFALRSTDPKAMFANPDAIGGRRNRDTVLYEAKGRDVVVAWGANVDGVAAYTNLLATRVQEVARSITCLGVTKGGHPRHPVRLPYAAERVAWP